MALFDYLFIILFRGCALQSNFFQKSKLTLEVGRCGVSRSRSGKKLINCPKIFTPLKLTDDAIHSTLKYNCHQ